MTGDRARDPGAGKEITHTVDTHPEAVEAKDARDRSQVEAVIGASPHPHRLRTFRRQTQRTLTDSRGSTVQH